MKTLEEITLLSGSHSRPEDGMCAMEAVAYIQGEPFSDKPACVCPVIAAFMRQWNDDLPDADRNALLKPILHRVVGTRSTPAVENRRAFLAIDWYVRTQLPAWLDLTPALKPRAEAVRSLAPIIDPPTLRAGEAALHAARAAAWDALKPTVITLQASAIDLLKRMVAEGEPSCGKGEVDRG